MYLMNNFINKYVICSIHQIHQSSINMWCIFECSMHRDIYTSIHHRHHRWCWDSIHQIHHSIVLMLIFIYITSAAWCIEDVLDTILISFSRRSDCLVSYNCTRCFSIHTTYCKFDESHKLYVILIVLMIGTPYRDVNLLSAMQCGWPSRNLLSAMNHAWQCGWPSRMFEFALLWGVGTS